MKSIARFYRMTLAVICAITIGSLNADAIPGEEQPPGKNTITITKVLNGQALTQGKAEGSFTTVDDGTQLMNVLLVAYPIDGGKVVVANGGAIDQKTKTWGPGTIEDLQDTKYRIWAIGTFTKAPTEVYSKVHEKQGAGNPLIKEYLTIHWGSGQPSTPPGTTLTISTSGHTSKADAQYTNPVLTGAAVVVIPEEGGTKILTAINELKLNGSGGYDWKAPDTKVPATPGVTASNYHVLVVMNNDAPMDKGTYCATPYTIAVPNP